MEADRTKGILPCYMVIPALARRPPSAHPRRCYGGVELGHKGHINHGISTALCGIRALVDCFHRTSFLSCNDSGKLLPSLDRRFLIRRPYHYESLHYRLRCVGSTTSVNGTLNIGTLANMRNPAYALFARFSSVDGDVGNLVRSAFSDPRHRHIKVTRGRCPRETQSWAISTGEH